MPCPTLRSPPPLPDRETVKHGSNLSGKIRPSRVTSQWKSTRLHAEVIPNVKTVTLRDVVIRNVEVGTTVSTDELYSYGLLNGDGYKHGSVKHGDKQWASKDIDGVKHHTNSVEGFWRLFKNAVRSTHIHVSHKHMERYLGEFTFRSNYRQMENAMFDLLIGAL